MRITALNKINWVRILIGVVVLVVGSLIYLIDRPPDQTYFVYSSPKEVILIGMNPGPWGMAQTGVPFGEIIAVNDWLGIKATIGEPTRIHPKRPVHGFQCKRSEVSGKRLWGWAKKTFITPGRFFSRFFVANYCPLMFIEADGRNRTPNHIRTDERKPLLSVCDQALRETVLYLRPRYVVGIGEFAAGRAKVALANLNVIIGRITHPSPANPKANKGWETLIEKELSQLGVKIRENGGRP